MSCFVASCICMYMYGDVITTDSSFEALSHRSQADWKKSIQVVFINEQGVAESGIDGGGLFKEFVDVLLKDLFSPPPLPALAPLHRGHTTTTTTSNSSSSEMSISTSSGGGGGGGGSSAREEDVIDWSEASDQQEEHKAYRDLFLTTTTGLLVPNPASLLDSDKGQTPRETLEQYRFMGKMLGKAVYEEILVEPQFAGMFLNHLLGRTNFIDDLVTLDQEVSGVMCCRCIVGEVVLCCDELS
jgi:hypothetical protein